LQDLSGTVPAIVTPKPGPDPPTLLLPRQVSIPAAARLAAVTGGVLRRLLLLLLRVTPAAAEVVLPLPFPFPFPFPFPLPVPELKLPLSLPFMIWACAAVAASSRNERAIKTFICELRDGYFPQNRKTYFRLVVWHSAFVLMTLGKIDHVAFLHRLTPDA
jgi:hypothetical protein